MWFSDHQISGKPNENMREWCQQAPKILSVLQAIWENLQDSPETVLSIVAFAYLGTRKPILHNQTHQELHPNLPIGNGNAQGGAPSFTIDPTAAGCRWFVGSHLDMHPIC